jgi:hypothetical protein
MTGSRPPNLFSLPAFALTVRHRREQGGEGGALRNAQASTWSGPIAAENEPLEPFTISTKDAEKLD